MGRGGKNQVTLTFAGDKDHLSRITKGVGTDLDDLDTKVGKSSTSMSQKIAGFGKAAMIGLAGVGVAATYVGLDFVKAAEESAAVSRQTETVLKSMGGAANVTADHVAKLSEKLSEKAGIDDEVIQSGQNVLLTFGNIRNEVGAGNKVFDRAATVALDMSVALGQDLQSSVTQVGKALNDPIAGLSALSRVGVQFTEDQKAMITELVNTGDTLGAQKIILEELERQFGGSAEAQATASGKLSVAWGNLQEQLGNYLIPVFEKVADWLADEIPKAIDTSIQWLKDHETQVKIAAIAIGVILAGAMLVYAVNAGIAAVATILATWPILLATAAAIALGVGLYYAYTRWGWFRDAVDSVIDVLQIVWQMLTGSKDEMWANVGAASGLAQAFLLLVAVLITVFTWATKAFGILSDLANLKGPSLPGWLDLPGGGLASKGDASKVSGGKKVGHFATGGTVPGPIGAPTLAIVHGGEKYTPYSASRGDEPLTVNVYVAGSIRSDKELVGVIRDELERGGLRGLVA